MSYAELQVTTHFSFLRGASSPEELFAEAARLGLPALGITDRMTLAGIVRCHEAARVTGVRLVVGCRLDLTDAPPLLVYSTDRAAYGRLCRLLTLGKSRAGKSACRLAWADVVTHAEGLIGVLLPDFYAEGAKMAGVRGSPPPLTPPHKGEGNQSSKPRATAPPPPLWGRAGEGGSPASAVAPALTFSEGKRTVEALSRSAVPPALGFHLDRLRETFGSRSYLALTPRFRPNEAMRLYRLAELARAARVPTVVTNDVLYHAEERRILQDVVTAVREKCTVDALGDKREAFADRFLKPPAEMARLLSAHPDALARTREIVARCRFGLDEIKYQYPAEAVIPGLSPQEALEKLTWEGAAWRYPGGVPDKVARQIRHELALIEELAYAPYFLTVRAIVAYARSQDILCQGRGSAANSAVCFCLGITAIDPERNNVLFERFVSRDRNEPPDIDVDFDSDRREEVIQWVYDHYGRDRAALAATVIRYRSRGAMTDVGKALGFPRDLILELTRLAWSWSSEGVTEKHARALNLNLDDYRVKLALRLHRLLMGVPRHLSQHPGGFVLTEHRLDEIVPIEPARMEERQVVEWDKDDLDALRIMKVDVLGLGMLGAMSRFFAFLAEHKRLAYDLATIPPEDAATFDRIGKADTIGVFQIESRAQQAMLPKTLPRTYYDLVVEVAIVRPGPIQGQMVHPYIRRRRGLEPVTYPSPVFEEILKKTLGVPLFQEQAMALAIHAAGFSPSEADRLRRSMATFKVTGGVSAFRDKFIGGMTGNGYERDIAERTFRMIEGFGSYGFPESHSASFAVIAYASAWAKCHHPDAFLAALVNAQPMGFYAVDDLIDDTRRHGVAVRPVDVNRSRWDCTLEPSASSTGGFAVRLGFRLVKGLKENEAARIVAVRGPEPFASVEDVWARAGVSETALKRLADADAFAAFDESRRATAWTAKGLKDAPLPLFKAADARTGRVTPEIAEAAVALPPLTPGEEVIEDYRTLGLSLRDYPVAFLREELAKRGATPAAALGRARDGARVTVAGLVRFRQMPGSAKGVVFVTLRDETGYAQLIVWPKLFEREERIVRTAGLMACTGRVQKDGPVIHVIAERLRDWTALLRRIGSGDETLYPPETRGDEIARGGSRPDPRSPKEAITRVPVGERGDAGITVRSRDFR